MDFSVKALLHDFIWAFEISVIDEVRSKTTIRRPLQTLCFHSIHSINLPKYDLNMMISWWVQYQIPHHESWHHFCSMAVEIRVLILYSDHLWVMKFRKNSTMMLDDYISMLRMMIDMMRHKEKHKFKDMMTVWPRCKTGFIPFDLIPSLLLIPHHTGTCISTLDNFQWNCVVVM